MKKILFVFAAILLLSDAFSQLVKLNSNGIKVNVLYSDDNLTRIEYLVGEFNKTAVTINSQIYYQVSLADESLLKLKGNPDLPKLSRSISIPASAKMQVSIVSSTYQELSLKVAPSKGIITRDVDPATVPYTFSSVYSQNAYTPSNRAELGEPYIIREKRGITLDVYPIAYNPVTQKLRIYTRLVVEIRNTGTDTRNVLPSSRSNILNNYFKSLYEKRFINFTESRELTENGRMLVIADNQFVDEMQAFVNWKNQRGLPTTMVSKSQAGSTASAIYNYIKNQYDQNDGLTFVLLVGDNAQIPTFTVSGGGSDPSYSLVSGDDNYPDIVVGRFSAETSAQVQTQVSRTIYYERDMSSSAWWHNGTGIGSSQGAGIGDDGEADWQHERNIRSELLGFHYTAVDEFYDGSQGGADATGNPTPSMLSSAFNSGRSIINYTGHGSVTSWTTSGFSVSNVNSLTNDYRLPFIFSVACVNGQFLNTTCFAEAWLRAQNSSNGNPTGAIGMYASTINQSWAPPMQAQDEFNSLLTGETYSTFGTLCYNASWSMMDEYGSADGSAGATMFLTWHVFGDPSLMVIPFTANCPEDLMLTETISGETCNFLAANSITATNLITSGADVYCGADHVYLKTGFKVVSGSHFRADYNGCTSVSGKSAIDNTIADDTKQNMRIEEQMLISNSELMIYPNPNQGSFTIEIADPDNPAILEIYNLSGSLVFSQQLTSGQSTVDSHLNPGVYTLLVRTDNCIERKSMIIE